MSDIQIRPMLVTDAKASAAVHMCTFQGFFLTFLGRRFLVTLYDGIVRDATGIAFVAESRERVIGFVAGSTHISGLYRRLLTKSLWSFGWSSFNAFLRKPVILPRLLRAFGRPAYKDPVPNSATLMSLGVLPEAQGCGVGRRLVLSFMDTARQRGLQNVILDTDREQNDSTNRFYQKLGFSVLDTYATPEGRQMNQYFIALGVPERVSAGTEIATAGKEMLGASG